LERIPRQFYTQEFKEEAVNLAENGGLTIAEVSRRLSGSRLPSEQRMSEDVYLRAREDTGRTGRSRADASRTQPDQATAPPYENPL